MAKPYPSIVADLQSYPCTAAAMGKGASQGVSNRMAFKNLLELKRNSAQESKRNYESQSGAAIAPPSPEGGFPSSPEAPHTAGGRGSTSHVLSEPNDSMRVVVVATLVPTAEASKALFLRSPSRLNDIIPLSIQEHVELLENLAKRVSQQHQHQDRVWFAF
ncbi:unnamed protein product [Polarella glacialis]|uniref:Uncharacterized protein n=2 Tax=Polarella glacialis TaxID=89957 RepID=A0A813LTA1_POLGL|nr:unnamed protein product [Polarella glacialis]